MALLDADRAPPAHAPGRSNDFGMWRERSVWQNSMNMLKENLHGFLMNSHERECRLFLKTVIAKANVA
eukprot:2953554-Pyramimonas_sp.AAC.1